MPRLIITTEPTDDRQPDVIYQEHIAADRIVEIDDPYADELMQRVGWGLFDAHDAERRPQAGVR